MKKLMVFTAAAVPTPSETAAIEALKAASYSVVVRNGADESAMMLGNRREDCDMVAGEVPDLYVDKPLYEPKPEGSAAIVDGQEITLGGTIYTFTVVDGEITAIDTGA